MPQTLPKSERLSGRTAVSELLKKGRWGYSADLKYCWLRRENAGASRMMVSVPKRNFKRAVKRNLLKRRVRESYRTQKGCLGRNSMDIMFVYSSKKIIDSNAIAIQMEEILKTLSQTVTE